MESKLFIHIGLPKSGSSFLQQRLFPVLQAKGVLNFLNVQKVYPIVSKIVFQDPFTYNPAEVRELLKAHMKPGVNVLTVEWFSGVIGYKSFNTRETAKRLYDTFPDATIMLILRNQIDFAYSAYKQHVHQGGVLSLEEYFNWTGNALATGFEHEFFKFDDHKFYWNGLLYSHLLDCYKPFKEKGLLEIFLFENFFVDAKKFIDHFLKAMNVQEDIEQFDFSPVNTGYGKNQIRIARVLNRFVHSPYNQIGFKPIPWSGKYKTLQAAHIRQTHHSDWSFKLFGNQSIRNPKIDDAIQRYFIADNEKVMQHIPGQDVEVFKRLYLNDQK